TCSVAKPASHQRSAAATGSGSSTATRSGRPPTSCTQRPPFTSTAGAAITRASAAGTARGSPGLPGEAHEVGEDAPARVRALLRVELEAPGVAAPDAGGEAHVVVAGPGDRVRLVVGLAH